MQLAGVVGIGEPQQGLRLDQLQYVLVKDQDSEPQGGKTSFWVFNKSQEIVVPGTASSERQTTEAVPDPTLPESSAAKQTAITDFFSPRPSTCPAQNSESSFPASTRFANQGMASKNSSSSSELAASELIGTALAKDEKKLGAKHNMKKTETAGDEERLAGIAKMEADYQSEIRIMKLTHEQAMREMEEKLDQKDELAKSATRLAEGAAAKLAATHAKPRDAGANSLEVYQLTKRRDGLLKEVESSRGKISDLTRSVQEIREQLATTLIQRDDTRTALAAAKAETKSAKVEATSAKAEATKAFDAGKQLSRLTDMANEELKRSNEKIEAILGGKGGEVIKGQIRLIYLLRAENEDFEQQLHASSSEIMNLKESEKAAADTVAKGRQLYKKELSKYKKEVLSCNTKILELEAKKMDFEKALQAGTGFVAVAILLRDREQTIADLTTRIEDIALLHQKEIKYENHVMEIQKELQCMYGTNDSLVREVSELKEDLEREMLNNDTLQDKVTLLQSNTLLKSRYNDICNKHTILNILTKEKLTLEKDCATLQKANAKLEQRRISEEELRKLIYDLFHRIIRLSNALSSRGAYPFNAAYSSLVDRAFIVAEIEAEDVYADATNDGYEHEFDTEWIEDDEEEEGSYDEKHNNDRGDDGDDEDNNEDEANGSSQEGNRGATRKRSMTGGKEMKSTVSAKRPVFSAPTSPAEEVETTINVAADDLEEMQKSPETFNAKVRSIDPSEGQAVLPTVDNTADNNDTELPAAQDVGDAYVNDVEYSNRTKKQAFMGRVGPVSAPAGIIDSESGEEFSFSKPFFTTKPGEATSLGTSSANTGLESGGKYAFGAGKNSPPSLFATPTASSFKSAGATNPSAEAKGGSQGIWKGVSFATSEDKPFYFKATPAADLETKSNFASEPVKAETVLSGHSEAKHGSSVGQVQREAAPTTPEKAFFPSRIQGFNFGEMGGPVSFTSSSPSVPTAPASTGMSSFAVQKSPPSIIQAKVKVFGDDRSEDESPKIDMSKTETPKEETPKEMSEVGGPEDESPKKEKQEKQMPKEVSTPQEEEIPEDAPAPSKPNRNQRRAAKKQQEKDAKKADKESKTANVQARRHVQQAMMMR